MHVIFDRTLSWQAVPGVNGRLLVIGLARYQPDTLNTGLVGCTSESRQSRHVSYHLRMSPKALNVWNI